MGLQGVVQFLFGQVPLLHVGFKDSSIPQGVFLFGVVIWAGYYGVNSFTANFDPTFIYVIFWVGMTLASVLFGDAFSALSPVVFREPDR